MTVGDLFGEEHSDRGGDANANGSYDLRYDEDGQDATLHGLLRRAERGVGRGGGVRCHRGLSSDRVRVSLRYAKGAGSARA